MTRTQFLTSLRETPDEITVAQLSRGVRILAEAGSIDADVTRQIRAAYRRLGVASEDIPAEIRESSVERTGNGLRESSIELTAPSEGDGGEDALPPGVIGVSPNSVLLRVGVNKTRRRKYTESFIREHMDRFNGSFSSIDHPTMSESKDRPERSLSTVAAVIVNPRWDVTENAAVGDVHYLSNTAGREMMETYRNPIVRERAGLSIFWPGEVKMRRERIVEGNLVDVPMQLVGDGRFDVDFVTRPSAGGRVGALRESEDVFMYDELTLEDLMSERPDLVEAIRNEGKVDETIAESDAELVEEPVAEAVQSAQETEDEEQTTEETQVSESDRIAELEATIRRMRGKEILADRLREADLPDKATSLVESDFADADCADETEFTGRVDARIAAVKDLVSTVATPRVHVPSERIAESAAVDVMADIRKMAGRAV